MPTKLQVLKGISLGHRVAEEEADALQKYFVKTNQWEQLESGQVDVVYGPKGSGKSALYTILIQNEALFLKKKVVVAAAENPRGATVFKAIATDPPPTEVEFTSLWKLYILVLAAKTLRSRGLQSPESKALIDALEQAKLLPLGDNLASYFKAVASYAKGWIGRDAASVEYEISVDATTGAPTVRRKVEYADRPERGASFGELPLDDLLQVADVAVGKAGFTLWIAFDRLDVAFAETPDLERNALRALFRAYNDLKSRSWLRMKIFVRDDVWRRITAGGFTEASHITKALHIQWTNNDLLNLVVLRLITSQELRDYYKVKVNVIKRAYDQQERLFYRIFPDQVDTGKNPPTLRWMISRTSDATAKGNPRELIHLVDVARQIQIKSLEQGGKPPSGDQLFDRASIKDALPLVSKVFFEQTLLAEYPDVRDYLQMLNGRKTAQRVPTLAAIWSVSEEKALEIAKRLSDIAFFEKKGNVDPEFRTPHLFRPALNMVQGQESK